VCVVVVVGVDEVDVGEFVDLEVDEVGGGDFVVVVGGECDGGYDVVRDFDVVGYEVFVD